MITLLSAILETQEVFIVRFNNLGDGDLEEMVMSVMLETNLSKELLEREIQHSSGPCSNEGRQYGILTEGGSAEKNREALMNAIEPIRGHFLYKCMLDCMSQAANSINGFCELELNKECIDQWWRCEIGVKVSSNNPVSPEELMPRYEIYIQEMHDDGGFSEKYICFYEQTVSEIQSRIEEKYSTKNKGSEVNTEATARSITVQFHLFGIKSSEETRKEGISKTVGAAFTKSKGRKGSIAKNKDGEEKKERDDKGASSSLGM